MQDLRKYSPSFNQTMAPSSSKSNIFGSVNKLSVRNEKIYDILEVRDLLS